MSTGPLDTIVVGAGMAGLACATQLAEQGRRVAVIESRVVLGGRASSWLDEPTQSILDNGPHLFAGTYDEVQRLLARVGTSEMVHYSTPLRVPLWSCNPVRRTRLEWRPGFGPFGLLAGMVTFGALSLAERVGLRLVLDRARHHAQEADTPLASWLDRCKQGEEARRWIWYPLVRAVFNEEPEIISSRLFAQVVLRLFLGGARASALTHSSYGLSDTYAEPAARFLENRGCKIFRGQSVESISRVEDRFLIRSREGSEWEAPSLCLAAQPRQVHRLLSQPFPRLAQSLSAWAEIPDAPLVTANFWLKDDRPLSPEPFVGFVDGIFSWYFERSRLANDSGPGCRVAVVAPGARSLLDLPSAEILEIAREELLGHLPTFADREVVATRVIKEPQAAPSLTPESEALRPPQETPVEGLFLAGDATSTGLPATLESAAVSGHRAAEGIEALFQVKA